MSSAPLLSAYELTKTFGTKALFTEISISLEEGEKVALIGPNGSGKSTLLRMIAGLEEADSGSVRAKKGLRSAYVAQMDVFDERLSIGKTLEDALVAVGYDQHEVAGKIGITCGRFGFLDKNILVGTLSGGWKKRLAIARGIIVEPELLLLDEPTNHLDIEGVIWLEEVLSKVNFAFLFVSHDRYFIESLAERVIEINRQYPKGFFTSEGAYGDFLEARSNFLIGLHQTKEALANKVRREVAWLRQGAKARTTKSKYRSEKALQMVEELKNFNLDEKKVALEFSASNRKSKDLIKLENVSKGFEDRKLFNNVTLTLSPGVRLGVVGPNGSGKTTFMRVLLGELKPDSGRVIMANNLRIAFFDQARKQLDESMSLKQTLCKEGDSVVFQGKSIHVAGWAERFLFSKDQLSLKVGSLSGGEQARVLLAQLMLQETDVVLFDEPTNDLDIKTLEVLEESFCDYPGAIVLITHDRYLLDRVANLVVGIEGEEAALYGSYEQWERARKLKRESQSNNNRESEKPEGAEIPGSKKRTKLSYQEQRELDGIEKTILQAEKLAELLQLECSSPNIISDPKALKDCCEKLSKQQKLVEALYERWQELEALKREIQALKSTKSAEQK